MKNKMKEDSFDDRNRAFVDKLVEQIGKSGARRAELRRFWSPTTRHYAFPILGHLGVLSSNPAYQYTTALYAINPYHKEDGRSIGEACLHLAGGHTQAAEFKSFEAHFFRLIASESPSKLAEQLARIFRRLNRLDEQQRSLDYCLVLKALLYWPNYSDQVKTRWSMEFWNASKSEGLFSQ